MRTYNRLVTSHRVDHNTIQQATPYVLLVNADWPANLTSTLTPVGRLFLRVRPTNLPPTCNDGTYEYSIWQSADVSRWWI